MNEIEAWLQAPDDYSRGLNLYNVYAPRYRPNAVIGSQVNAFENSFTAELLRTELAAILAMLRKPEPKAGTSGKPHTRGMSAGLPPDLAKIDRDIQSYYKKRDYYRYAMRELEPGPSLRDMAYNAVRYDLMIRDAYRLLDYWQRTGMYPPGYFGGEDAEQSKVEQLTDWLRALKAFPSFISRNRKNPERAAEVAAKQKVLDEINEYLAYADSQE